MVKVGGSAPAESADAKAARERAEASAEERKIGEIRRGVSAETASILRAFGIKAAASGSPGAGSYVASGFSGFAGGSSGSGGVNPGAAAGGFGSVSRGFQYQR